MEPKNKNGREQTLEAAKTSARELADREQDEAARDMNKYVRVIAGPGTGKTKTIQKRIVHLLEAGANANNIFVLTFLRGARNELEKKIKDHCEENERREEGKRIKVLTLHSLALRILRRSGLLEIEEDEYRILNAWEAKEIFDGELARRLKKSPTDIERTREIFEDGWETLNEPIMEEAKKGKIGQAFEYWHSVLTTLYSIILPGEAIYKCVKAFKEVPGKVVPSLIEHIIVDEYQDLNKCDQAFIKMLSAHSNSLWVAGDDDQSIYSFRNADPRGLEEFEKNPMSKSYQLKYCFRCTPAVLESAKNIITKIENRQPKDLEYIFGEVIPTLKGVVHSCHFSSPSREYEAVAIAVKSLLDEGYGGKEKEILILLAWKKPEAVQLKPLVEALKNSGVDFELPSEPKNEAYEAKVVYYLLRVLQGFKTNRIDKFAHRAILHLTKDIGLTTISNVADYCLRQNVNYLDGLKNINNIENIQPRRRIRIEEILTIIRTTLTWELTDLFSERSSDINYFIKKILHGDAYTKPISVEWDTLVSLLPPDFTLTELLDYLSAPSEAERIRLIQRAEETPKENEIKTADKNHKVKVLTIHGSKGLDGGIVFIPGVEEGIIPNKKALESDMLMAEQRRLFYVALTRARLACVLTRAKKHYEGGAALILGNEKGVSLRCSCFKKEIGVPELRCNDQPSDFLSEIKDFASKYYPND